MELQKEVFFFLLKKEHRVNCQELTEKSWDLWTVHKADLRSETAILKFMNLHMETGAPKIQFISPAWSNPLGSKHWPTPGGYP